MDTVIFFFLDKTWLILWNTRVGHLSIRIPGSAGQRR